MNLFLREAHAGWREITQGKTNEEIGDILGCSCRTVQKHLERIYIKLGVENRTAAATLATEAARTYRKSNGSGT
jgi:DNA-binding CsgD family transcriptional regulator